MDKRVTYTDCPFTGERCYQSEDNNCEFFNRREYECALRTVASKVTYFDADFKPETWYYNADEKKLEEGLDSDNALAHVMFNIGSIPPLLERIAKALEKMAEIE
jgi:hypothetical protein